jgi:hypothetical protein
MPEYRLQFGEVGKANHIIYFESEHEIVDPTSDLWNVVDILTERGRQDRKFPNQSALRDDGHMTPRQAESFADHWKVSNDYDTHRGQPNWFGIFMEEFYEAFAEEDQDLFRQELVQALAVGFRILNNNDFGFDDYKETDQ